MNLKMLGLDGAKYTGYFEGEYLPDAYLFCNRVFIKNTGSENPLYLEISAYRNAILGAGWDEE